MTFLKHLLQFRFCGIFHSRLKNMRYSSVRNKCFQHLEIVFHAGFCLHSSSFMSVKLSKEITKKCNVIYSDIQTLFAMETIPKLSSYVTTSICCTVNLQCNEPVERKSYRLYLEVWYLRRSVCISLLC